jgi:hypothetical protein
VRLQAPYRDDSLRCTLEGIWKSVTGYTPALRIKANPGRADKQWPVTVFYRWQC